MGTTEVNQTAATGTPSQTGVVKFRPTEAKNPKTHDQY